MACRTPDFEPWSNDEIEFGAPVPLRPSQIPQQHILLRKGSNTRAPTSGLFIMTAALNMAAYNTGSYVILNVTLDFLVAA
jgi:hypothetical protein